MLEDYLQELQKIALLQPEEEAALWQAYKEGGDANARSRLIEQYQPLVFKEAMRWHIHPDLLLDALQEGTLGLMDAVERYDHRRGVAFPLFAVHRIRGAILDYLKREGAVSAMSLDAPDEQGMTLQDTLCDDSPDPAEAASRQFLLKSQRRPEPSAGKRTGRRRRRLFEGCGAEAFSQGPRCQSALRIPPAKTGIRRVRGMLSRFIHDSRD